jgi:transposase
MRLEERVSQAIAAHPDRAELAARLTSVPSVDAKITAALIAELPKLAAFRERLLAKGKSKKAALIAGARRLLTILNALVRSGQAWNPDYVRQQHSR